jgi:RHS repeat-associated protein
MSLLCAIGNVQAAKVTYIYTDTLGTPLAEADTSGDITSTFDYRPFGKIATASDPDGPGFTGHVNDTDSDLIYMNARYYDGLVGRFVSADPAGQKAGFNVYSYVNNNPVNRFDPDGLYECGDENSCHAAALIAKGLKDAQSSFSSKSSDYKKLAETIKFFGDKNDGNGITVKASFGDSSNFGGGQGDSEKKTGELTINLTTMHRDERSDYEDFANLVATGSHELKHIADDIAGIDRSGRKGEFKHEVRGILAESPVWKGLGVDDKEWNTWTKKDGFNMQNVNKEAQRATDVYCSQGGC